MVLSNQFRVTLALAILFKTNAFSPSLPFVIPSKNTQCLLMSSNGKDSHRARVEKNLEDMMNNDWRVFRAQLVARESLEAKENQEIQSKQVPHSSKEQVQDEKQAKQEKLGHFFASIFSQKNNDAGARANIFDGHEIGGANSSSLIPEKCEDPFVSHAEIPVLLEPKVHLDKRKWAHPISHIEQGCILIANEKLGGVFHQTVVLIVDHNESTGSTGIIINRPLAGKLLKVASETKSNLDLSLKMAFNSATVSYGGPVMQEEYSILHGYGEVEGSKKVAPGIFVGGSEELMNEVRRCNLAPQDALFVKGHAAWVPNQLSREVSKGVWYMASCSNDFILRYAKGEGEGPKDADLWAEILNCMGGKFADIAEKNAGKGDMRMMP